jgi:hypothetical protein
MTTIADVPAILKRCIRTGTNLAITGEPGCGKTSIIEQTVAEIQAGNKEFGFWQVYTPSLSPTDFVMMMPDIESGTLKPFRNALLPNAYDNPNLCGVLFLGENENADPATNKALQKYINNEDMGRLRKPKGVIVVSDSNRVGDRSGTVQQSLALISRSRRVHLDVDAEVTLKYFAKREVNPFVQAYLSLRREHVSWFDALVKTKGYGVWANPRSWERLAVSMDDADTHNEKLSHEEIIGDIGEAVGREFIAFLHAAKELVSYADIVANPLAAAQPEKLSDTYAIIAMLSGMTRATDLGQVRKYVERYGAEVQVLFLRLLVSGKGAHRADCIKSKEYTQWFSKPELLSALGV